jgi:hypothetical protein
MCYLRSMNWTEVLSGAAGGLAGSAVPGWLAWLGLRREGTSSAKTGGGVMMPPVVADVMGLLRDVHPDRRAASISDAPAAEQATWDDILTRRAAVGTRLLSMAAGHPSDSVRGCAQDLEGQLAASVVQTQWLVKDQLEHRDIPGQYDTARKCHETATATAGRLQELITAFGSGRRRK